MNTPAPSVTLKSALLAMGACSVVGTGALLRLQESMVLQRFCPTMVLLPIMMSRVYEKFVLILVLTTRLRSLREGPFV